MFPHKALVELQRETQERGEKEVLEPIEEGLESFEARDALGQVAHLGRPAQVQQEQRDGGGIEKIPENQPVAALKVGVGTGLGRGRNHGHVGLGGRIGVKVRRGLRSGRDLGNVDHGLKSGLCLD